MTESVHAPNDPTQIPYEPRSQGRPMGTLIPRNMASAAQTALSRFEQQHGPIDEFVRANLGYPSTDELHRRLYAEQIDTIALAMSNVDQGHGFVIGDQTGIGKGCQCAALIHYGARQGKPVIFLTQKASLYKDILRDLDTLGVRDFAPFLTDNNAKITLDGAQVLRTGTGEQQTQEMKRLMGLGNLGSYDAVFTTYNQIQTVTQKEPFRRHFLRSLAERGALLICDESHEAGGSPAAGWKANNAPPTRAEFMRELIDLTLASGGGVVYSSATYSKRPDVMDLYARSTDLRYAVGQTRSLAKTLKAGGIPLQQVIAAKFVKSGQMMRRERSFEGVSFETLTIPADKETADQFSAAMRAINTFDRVKNAQIRQLTKALKKEAKRLARDAAIGEVGVKSTNFTSLMHNCIEQGLLAQKAEATVQASLASLKAGAKPVIAVDNTMEAFIKAWVDTHDASPGDTVTITFSDLLERYLERSRDISVTDHTGVQTRSRMTDAELGPEGVAAYLEARDIIRNSDLSAIPISPIDYIKGRLEQEGYATTEVTGRKSMLSYAADGSAVYQTRSAKAVSTAGKIAAVNDFNSGRADVIVINRSGAAGISLHASERFQDQRPRRMLVAQASRDINTFMQTLGRIHRTGQVALPSYTLLTTDLPAEKRPAAILSRKMATLNANVTADRETATSIQGVVDFFNEYGEAVIEQLLEERPELNDQLDNPLGSASDDDLALIAKVTGRLPLLTVEAQEQTYQLIEMAYQDFVAQKEAMGESLLKADSLDLDARTVARMEVIPADTQLTNEFSGPVCLEVVDAKSLSKPLTQLQVANQVRETLGVPTRDQVEAVDWASLMQRGQERSAQLAQDLHQATHDYATKKLAALAVIKRQQLQGLPDGVVPPVQERIDKLTQKLEAQLDFVTSTLQAFPIGSSVRLVRQTSKGASDVFYGVVIGIDHKDRGSSPAVPSSWHLNVALSNAEAKSMVIPVSALSSVSRPGKARANEDSLQMQAADTDLWSGQPIYQLFDRRQQEVRQQQQILTGNLVKAFDRYASGKLINFTDHKGRIRQGLLLPKSFEMAKQLQQEPVAFAEPTQVKAFLTELTEGKGGLKTLDQTLSIRLHSDGARLILEAPRAKDTGGKYYLDADLIDRVGQDFVSHQSHMRVVVSAENAEQTLAYLLAKEPVACFDPEYLPMARDYMGVKIPEFERAPEGGTLDVEDEFIEANVVPYVDEPTQADRDRLEHLFQAPLDRASSLHYPAENGEVSLPSSPQDREPTLEQRFQHADTLSAEPSARANQVGTMDIKTLTEDPAIQTALSALADNPNRVIENPGRDSEFIPTPEAELLRDVLGETPDPEVMLEIILPSNMTVDDLTRRIQDANQAIAVAEKYNVTEFSGLYEVREALREAVEAKDDAQLPPVPGAKELFDVFVASDDIEPVFEYVIGGYTKRELNAYLKEAETPEDVAAIELALREDVRKAAKRFERWDPDQIDTGDYETLEDALYYKGMYELAKHPVLREIGRVLETETEAAEQAYDWLYDEVRRLSAEKYSDPLNEALFEQWADLCDRRTGDLSEAEPATLATDIDRIEQSVDPNTLEQWHERYETRAQAQHNLAEVPAAAGGERASPADPALDAYANQVLDELAAIAQPVDALENPQIRGATILDYRQLPSVKGLPRPAQDKLFHHLTTLRERWEIEVGTLQETHLLSDEQRAQTIPQDIGGPLFYIDMIPAQTLDPQVQDVVQPLTIPKASSEQWAQVYASLTQDHHLPTDLVNQAFQQGKVFADDQGKAVFALQHLREGGLTGEAPSHGQTQLRSGEIAGYATQSGTAVDYATGSSTAQGWFQVKPGSAPTTRIAITETPLEALSLAALNRAQGQAEDTLYLALNGEPSLPAQLLNQHLERGGDVILAFKNTEAGFNLNIHALQQVPGAKSLYLDGNLPDWNAHLQQTTREHPDAFTDLAQTILTAPPIEDLRDWYRKAALMQRSEGHLNRIAQVGRQEAAFTPLDHRVIAADNRAFALSERFTLQAQLILSQRGTPHANGDIVLQMDAYQLRGSADGNTFSVDTPDRGTILDVQDGSLQQVSITPQDVHAFEQYCAPIRTQRFPPQRTPTPHAATETDHVR